MFCPPKRKEEVMGKRSSEVKKEKNKANSLQVLITSAMRKPEYYSSKDPQIPIDNSRLQATRKRAAIETSQDAEDSTLSKRQDTHKSMADKGKSDTTTTKEELRYTDESEDEEEYGINIESTKQSLDSPVEFGANTKVGVDAINLYLNPTMKISHDLKK
ncbi:hypothetical protein BGZ49_008627 [Haplosporangium sp. Z 27]|nr:hypothetical protein BGZ49_008627 [Haplosporangium sp. Z 27]